MSACKKDTTSPAQEVQNSRIDYLTYTTNGVTYKVSDPFIGLNWCEIDQNNAGYQFSMRSAGYDDSDVRNPVILDLLTDPIKSSSAVTTYNVSPRSEAVIETLNRGEYDPEIKYSSPSGKIIITQADKDAIKGTYQLSISNGTTAKAVSGEFVNYDPE